ncbi:MAG: PEP-CTERM sorting domain-containing protein [Planctomycetota bacterium]
MTAKTQLLQFAVAHMTSSQLAEIAAKDITMNGDKPKHAMCSLVALLLLSCMPASAATIAGDPTFLVPNTATNNPFTYTSPRPVQNGYALTAFYFDSEGNQVRNETGAVYSSTPMSLSWGPSNSYSNAYADAGSFEAQSSHNVSTDGSQNYYSYGSAQVWNWYVLSGAPGEQVALAADILVKGSAYANNGAGGNAGTIFNTSLSFLSAPEDLIQDRVIVLNGAVNWTAGFSTVNTVDEDVLWDIGDDMHELNYIIRSQPFTVTAGVPFRLSLISSTQGFAGPGAWGEAWSDFYDPRLVTSQDFGGIPELTPDGFAVVLDGGQYSNLSAEGYSISTVPEPSSLLLLSTTILGIVALRRRVIGRWSKQVL